MRSPLSPALGLSVTPWVLEYVARHRRQVQLNADHQLAAVAYLGVAHARQLSVTVKDRMVNVAAWYEHIDLLTKLYSVFTPAHRRSYLWDGHSFIQTSGADQPKVLAPSKDTKTGDPVTLSPPAMIAMPCGGTLQFTGGKAHLGDTTYELLPHAALLDPEHDQNQEIVVQIRCHHNGSQQDLLYLLRQTSTGFETADMP